MKKFLTPITGLLLIVAIAIIIFLLQREKEKEIIEIPFVINLPLPVVIGTSDTIKLPGHIKENPINEELVKEFNKLKDSAAKLALYKEAIKEREYNITYPDNFQTVNVFTVAQGKILKQAISYETNKDYTIPIDTVLHVPIPKKIKVYAGAEIGIPIYNISNGPVFKANILLQNKKDNILSVSGDTEKNLFLGYNIKL